MKPKLRVRRASDDANDQAAGLRRMAREHQATQDAPTARDVARPGLTVAVTSGKGGVGKTNIAVNLSLCLQARGLATSLVDLDMGLANADLILGANPDCDLYDVLHRRRDLDDAIKQTESGVHFATATVGAGSRNPLNDIERARMVDLARRMPGDVCVLDCAAGIDSNVTAFARSADVVLVVTTPEPTALTDAYATVKTLFLEGYGGSVRVLVNMVETRTEAREAFERLQQTCEKFLKFPIADAGYVLHDTHVELAVRQRSPVVMRYPRCSASICVTAIAARLVGGRSVARRAPDLLRRVVGMFV
ncbi:MAG: AAA family ATPase [Phycisphaerales bacterium]|nr:AAA family ATPase [Phycisphaerales bacterium]